MGTNPARVITLANSNLRSLRRKGRDANDDMRRLYYQGCIDAALTASGSDTQPFLSGSDRDTPDYIDGYESALDALTPWRHDECSYRGPCGQRCPADGHRLDLCDL